MTRAEIITNLKKYFDIKELVSEVVYKKHLNDAWFVFDTDTLHCLLLLREGIGKSITINNWHNGGSFSQRGYRENTSSLVANKKTLYISGHMLGKAFDLDVAGMSAVEVRAWIYSNADLFPCKIRLENINTVTNLPISWVHFDTCYYESKPKIYLFNV